jgi:hypothetical protein
VNVVIAVSSLMIRTWVEVSELQILLPGRAPVLIPGGRFGGLEDGEEVAVEVAGRRRAAIIR